MSAHLIIRDAALDDAEAMARIQVEGWNRAYASFIPDQLPASYDIGVRHAQWRERLADPAPGTVHLVAAEGDAILAIAGGGPPLRDEVIVEGDTDTYTSQVYGLYVTPARYGGGIGRLMLGELATRLARQGHENLCLWAFELNPFRRFYDRLGGQQIARGEWQIAGTTIIEIAYGWPEIGDLIWACSSQGKTE
jgi:GNAT superfamily N-acetyltransferase